MKIVIGRMEAMNGIVMIVKGVRIILRVRMKNMTGRGNEFIQGKRVLTITEIE